MNEKILSGFMLICFICCLFCIAFQISDKAELENRITTAEKEIEHLEKELRITKSNSEFVINLVTGGKND